MENHKNEILKETGDIDANEIMMELHRFIYVNEKETCLPFMANRFLT